MKTDFKNCCFVCVCVYVYVCMCVVFVYARERCLPHMVSTCL